MNNLNEKQLREYLLNGVSLDSLHEFAKQTTIDNKLLAKLFALMKENSEIVSWRAAWVIWHLFNPKKELLKPYLDEISKLLSSFPFDGQKREMMKILLLFDIKELNISILLNTCFDFLSNPNESLAVQVHSMQILYHISEIEPDIRTELISTIEYMMPTSNFGFKNRAKKLLQKLQQ